jgi:hypothetical protein
VSDGVIQYSQRLKQHLEKSLQSAFRQPFLKLTDPPGKKAVEFHIRLDEDLRGGRSTAHEDDGSEPIVMEIITPAGARSTFWFTFVAAFRQEQSLTPSLQHASLLIFHEMAGDIIPLFRAEWDQVATACAESKHAQPHWHFVQRPARIERLVKTFMASSTEVARDFAPEEKSDLFADSADCSRIHFAMTSLWEEKAIPPYLKRTFDADEFPKWFANLTRYIAEQVAYTVSHMPGGGTVTEFDPLPDGNL